MLDTNNKEEPRPKCYFTHSILPAFVDHEQPTQKKRPFSTINECSYSHTIDLLLPKSSQNVFLDKLGDKSNLQYAKVYMKLSDLIEGAFFSDYIKTGNILMLSEGRPGFDNIFSLHDGILRLELEKASYERTGLTGTSIPSEGRKHVKARFAVEINLRLPSMVRGKQGFERIVWAFKNVLNMRKAWLFYDLKGANDGSGPIAAHQPIIKTSEAEVHTLDEIMVPAFPEALEPTDHQTPTELLEWVHLVISHSPRVCKGDDVDTYLSRYCILETDQENGPSVEQLTRIRWRGFIPASFVQTVTIGAMRAAGNDWFELSSRSFTGETYTFLQHGQQTLTWQFGS